MAKEDQDGWETGGREFQLKSNLNLSTIERSKN